MSHREQVLYELDLTALRTICNARMGLSCRDANGNYLPKDRLIALIMMESNNTPPLPPRRLFKTDLRDGSRVDMGGYMIPCPLPPS